MSRWFPIFFAKGLHLSTWSWVTSSNILCITYTCINTFSHMRHLHAYFTSGPFCGYTPPSGPSEGIIVLAKMPKKITSGHLLWVFHTHFRAFRGHFHAFKRLLTACGTSLLHDHMALTKGMLWVFQFMQVIDCRYPHKISSKALFQNNVDV